MWRQQSRYRVGKRDQKPPSFFFPSFYFERRVIFTKGVWAKNLQLDIVRTDCQSVYQFGRGRWRYFLGCHIFPHSVGVLLIKRTSWLIYWPQIMLIFFVAPFWPPLQKHLYKSEFELKRFFLDHSICHSIILLVKYCANSNDSGSIWEKSVGREGDG